MPDTIKQRSVSVVIRDATGERTVKVRRLSWKAAKNFYTALAGVVAQLFARPAGKAAVLPRGATDAEVAAAINPSSSGFSLFEALPTIVKESDALIAALLTNATDLTAAELDALDYGDVLSLLTGALAVNLDDEIKNSCAGVVAQIRGFYAAAPAEKTPATPPAPTT